MIVFFFAVLWDDLFPWRLSFTLLSLTHSPPVCQHIEPADTCLRRHSPPTVLNAKNNQRDTHCCRARFSRGANTRLVWLTNQTVNRHETQQVKGLIGQCLCLKLFNSTQVLPINFGWAIAERVNPLERTTHARLTGVMMLHYRKNDCGGTRNDHYYLLVARI